MMIFKRLSDDITSSYSEKTPACSVLYSIITGARSFAWFCRPRCTAVGF